MAEERIIPFSELMGMVEDDAPVPTAYAQHARIVAVNEEIFIDFLMIMPKFKSEEPMVRVVQRMIMPAKITGGLIKALQVTDAAIKARNEPPKAEPAEGE